MREARLQDLYVHVSCVHKAGLSGWCKYLVECNRVLYGTGGLVFSYKLTHTHMHIEIIVHLLMYTSY